MQWAVNSWVLEDRRNVYTTKIHTGRQMEYVHYHSIYWMTEETCTQPQYLQGKTMEMSPYGEMVCARIHGCKFLMNCYIYLLLLCANYCITYFRVWQNSNIQILFKQSFYYYVHIFKKKVKVYLQRKNTLCISVIQHCWSKIVMRNRRNSKVTCGPQKHTHKYRIVLTFPPPYFLINYHFTKLPIYNFVFPSVILKRILKTFWKSDVIIKFTLCLG